MKTQGQGRFGVFAHHPAGQIFPLPATGLSPGSQKLSLMEPPACPNLGSVKRQILGCRPASCISEGDCSHAVSATSHSGMSSAHFPPDPEVCPGFISHQGGLRGPVPAIPARTSPQRSSDSPTALKRAQAEGSWGAVRAS